MMIYRRGASLGPRSLGGVLRARWDRLRESRQRSIDKRAANKGVPSSDDPPCETCGRPAPPLEPLDPYNLGDGYDDVTVEFRALRKASFEELSHAFDEAPDRETAAAVLRESLIAVTGLEDVDGPVEIREVTEEALDLFEDNKLLTPLVLAWGYLHTLEDDARKNCGASQPSTSGRPDTTATRAQPQAERERDATEAADRTSPERTVTPDTATTPPTRAPAAS